MTFILVCICVVDLNEKDFCFEYYTIIACGLTDLNTWTLESMKKSFMAL